MLMFRFVFLTFLVHICMFFDARRAFVYVLNSHPLLSSAPINQQRLLAVTSMLTISYFEIKFIQENMSVSFLNRTKKTVLEIYMEILKVSIV